MLARAAPVPNWEYKGESGPWTWEALLCRCALRGDSLAGRRSFMGYICREAVLRNVISTGHVPEQEYIGDSRMY
jgi:hypothetical protein